MFIVVAIPRVVIVVMQAIRKRELLQGFSKKSKRGRDA